MDDERKRRRRYRSKQSDDELGLVPSGYLGHTVRNAASKEKWSVPVVTFGEDPWKVRQWKSKRKRPHPNDRLMFRITLIVLLGFLPFFLLLALISRLF